MTGGIIQGKAGREHRIPREGGSRGQGCPPRALHTHTRAHTHTHTHTHTRGWWPDGGDLAACCSCRPSARTPNSLQTRLVSIMREGSGETSTEGLSQCGLRESSFYLTVICGQQRSRHITGGSASIYG